MFFSLSCLNLFSKSWVCDSKCSNVVSITSVNIGKTWTADGWGRESTVTHLGGHCPSEKPDLCSQPGDFVARTDCLPKPSVTYSWYQYIVTTKGCESISPVHVLTEQWELLEALPSLKALRPSVSLRPAADPQGCKWIMCALTKLSKTQFTFCLVFHLTAYKVSAYRVSLIMMQRAFC